MKQVLKSTAIIVLIVIMSCMALVSCNDKNDGSEKMLYTEDTTLGEGKVQFTFVCEHIDGKKITFKINTDKTTLSEALKDVNLIEGEDSQYGLYVKKVNGITQDYDIDGSYWALYIDGEYAQTGVDSTTIDPVKTYTFKAEK